MKCTINVLDFVTKAQIAKNVSDRLRKRTFSNLIAIRVFALVAKSFHKTLIVAFRESFLVNLFLKYLEYNVTRGKYI